MALDRLAMQKRLSCQASCHGREMGRARPPGNGAGSVGHAETHRHVALDPVGFCGTVMAAWRSCPRARSPSCSSTWRGRRKSGRASSKRCEHAETAERRSRSRLGTIKSEEVWKQGWAMSFDQAIDYALGDGEPEAAVDAGPLSLREREVAKLVAAGMTNREIAKRLFISERTAEGHVEHIRNKLGVRSRTEIATWAVQRGLTKTGPGPN